jgi:hypothetical protein
LSDCCGGDSGLGAVGIPTDTPSGGEGFVRSVRWVDLRIGPGGDGTELAPFETVALAHAAVPDGGTLMLVGGDASAAAPIGLAARSLTFDGLGGQADGGGRPFKLPPLTYAITSGTQRLKFRHVSVTLTHTGPDSNLTQLQFFHCPLVSVLADGDAPLITWVGADGCSFSGSGGAATFKGGGAVSGYVANAGAVELSGINVTGAITSPSSVGFRNGCSFGGGVVVTAPAITLDPTSYLNAILAGATLTGAVTVAAGFIGVTDDVLTRQPDGTWRGAAAGAQSSLKQTVRAATTANITLSGAQTVDGVALIAGNRCLVKDQSAGAQNGIYVVAAGAWARATDADSDAKVRSGMLVPISEGTVNGDRVAFLTTNDAITLGTTALVFSMERLPPLTATAPADVTKAAASVGTATEAARRDHKHDVSTAAPAAGAVAVGNSAAEGGSTSLARADHTHQVTAATPVDVGTANAPGAATTFCRSDHVHNVPFSAVQNALNAASSAVSVNSQRITNVATPTTGTDAVNKTYVDGLAAGLDIKPSVVALATTNVATRSGLAQTVDGVALNTIGMRVLLTAQSTASQNGFWVVQSGSWTRPTDFATGSDAAGAFAFVEQGTANADKGWVCTTNSPSAVVDTNNLAFTQFSGIGGAAGSNGQVQYNSAGALAGASITTDGSGFIGVGYTSYPGTNPATVGRHRVINADSTGFLYARNFANGADIRLIGATDSSDRWVIGDQNNLNTLFYQASAFHSWYVGANEELQLSSTTLTVATNNVVVSAGFVSAAHFAAGTSPAGAGDFRAPNNGAGVRFKHTTLGDVTALTVLSDNAVRVGNTSNAAALYLQSAGGIGAELASGGAYSYTFGGTPKYNFNVARLDMVGANLINLGVVTLDNTTLPAAAAGEVGLASVGGSLEAISPNSTITTITPEGTVNSPTYFKEHRLGPVAKTGADNVFVLEAIPMSAIVAGLSNGQSAQIDFIVAGFAGISGGLVYSETWSVTLCVHYSTSGPTYTLGDRTEVMTNRGCADGQIFAGVDVTGNFVVDVNSGNLRVRAQISDIAEISTVKVMGLLFVLKTAL